MMVSSGIISLRLIYMYVCVCVCVCACVHHHEPYISSVDIRRHSHTRLGGTCRTDPLSRSRARSLSLRLGSTSTVPSHPVFPPWLNACGCSISHDIDHTGMSNSEYLSGDHAQHLRKTERRKIEAQVQTKVAMRRDERLQREAEKAKIEAARVAAVEEVVDEDGNVTKLKPAFKRQVSHRAMSKRDRAMRRMYHELGEDEQELIDPDEEKKKKKAAALKKQEEERLAAEEAFDEEHGVVPPTKSAARVGVESSLLTMASNAPKLDPIHPIAHKMKQAEMAKKKQATAKAAVVESPKLAAVPGSPGAESTADSPTGGGRKPFGVVFKPYEGDAFGTRGNYVEGMVYQSRLARAKTKRTGVLAQFFDDGKKFSPETEEDVDDTVSIVSTDQGSKQRCAATLFNLSKYPGNIDGMVAEGSVAALISLGKGDDNVSAVMVAGAFANLTGDRNACETIIHGGATETIVALSHFEAPDVRKYACKAIFNLTRIPGMEAMLVQQGILASFMRLRAECHECALAVSLAVCNLSCVTSFYLRMEKVVQVTITIINSILDNWGHSMSDSLEVLRPCMQAIKNYSNIEAFRVRLMEEGALSVLLGMMKTKEMTMVEMAAAVLLDLSRAERNRPGMVRDKTVPALLEMCKYNNEAIKQYCGMTLSQLALSEANQMYVINQGLPILLSLTESNNYKTIITCAKTLAILSANRRGSARLIQAGGVEKLVAMINQDIEEGASELKRAIVNALGHLLSHDAVTNSTLLGVVPILVKLCRLDDPYICEECTMVIYRISCKTSNLPAMSESKAIEVIMDMLSTAPDMCPLQQACVSTLCNIASGDQSQLVRMKDANAIPMLLRLVTSENKQIQEDCAQSLCSLAEVPVCAKEIVREGLASLLQLATGKNLVTQNWCAAIICSLSFDDSTRIAQLNAGVRDALITLAAVEGGQMAQRCATAFCNLTCNPSAADKLADSETIKTLLALGGAYSEETRSSCARALCNLSARPGVEHLMVNSRAVPELMVMALVRSESRMTKRLCAKTLMNILVPETMEKMFDMGVVWAISSLAKIELGEGESHDEGMVLACATAFHNISCHPVGQDHILGDKLALQAIFFFLYEGSHAVKDACWKTLWNIIQASDRHVDLIDAGLLHWLECLAVDAQSLGTKHHKTKGMDMADDIDLNDHVLTMIFNLIDADNSRTLEKQELIDAVNDNQQVLELLHTSKLLRPLLKPDLYQEAFLHLETTNEGHVTYAEFKSFILTVVTAAAKKEARDVRRQMRASPKGHTLSKDYSEKYDDDTFEEDDEDVPHDTGKRESHQWEDNYESRSAEILKRAAIDNLGVCLRAKANGKMLHALARAEYASPDECNGVEFVVAKPTDEGTVFVCMLGAEDGQVAFQSSYGTYLSVIDQSGDQLGTKWTLGSHEMFEIISGEEEEGDVVHLYVPSIDKFVSSIDGLTERMGRDTAFETVTPGWDFEQKLLEAKEHARVTMYNCAKAMKVLASNAQNCERLVQEGAMSILVALARAESMDTKLIISTVVAIFAEHKVTRETIVAEGAMATMEMLGKTQNMAILSLCAKTIYMLSLYLESAPVLIQQGLVAVVEDVIYACIQDASAEGKEVCLMVLRGIEHIARVEPVRLRMIAEEIVPAILDALEFLGEVAYETIVICLTHFAVLRRARKALVTGGATGALARIGLETKTADMEQRVALVLSYLASVNNSGMRQAMVYSGVLPVLLKLAKTDRHEIKECVADAIASLSRTKEVRKAMVKAGTLHTVQELADCGSEIARNHCTVAMTKLSTSVSHMDIGTVSTLIELCMAPGERPEATTIESLESSIQDAVTRLPPSLPFPPLVELERFSASALATSYDPPRPITWKKVADNTEGQKPPLPDFVDDGAEAKNLQRAHKSGGLGMDESGVGGATVVHEMAFAKVEALPMEVEAALNGAGANDMTIEFSDDEQEDEAVNLSALSDLYAEKKIVVQNRGSPRSRTGSIVEGSPGTSPRSPSSRSLKKTASFVDPTQLERSMTLPGGKTLPGVLH